MKLYKYLIIISCLFLFQNCETRKVTWNKAEKPLIRNTPEGMCYVGSGRVKTIIKGDSAKAEKNDTIVTTIRPFYMQQTEVTNLKYKEFVFWVKDSILRERFAKYDPTFKKINTKGDTVLNWDKPMPNPLKKRWTKVIYNESMLINKCICQYIYNPSLFNYRYRYYDKQSAIKWETAILNGNRLSAYDTLLIDSFYINKNGKIASQPLIRKVKSKEDFYYDKIVNVYPDTTVWLNKEYITDKNDMYANMYFSRLAYNNYPVVGITGHQIEGYCNWLNTIKEIKNKKEFGEYRLPTEIEWDYAARKGFDDFESADPRKTLKSMSCTNACYNANFSPPKGKLSFNSYFVTAPVGCFPPNKLGMFDLLGNAAEWTEKSLTTNRKSQRNNKEEDNFQIVKGGSFIDKFDFDRNSRDAYQFNKPYCFIGFRLVRSCKK